MTTECKCHIPPLSRVRELYDRGRSDSGLITLHWDCPEHGRKVRPSLWRGWGRVPELRVTFTVWYGLDQVSKPSTDATLPKPGTPPKPGEHATLPKLRRHAATITGVKPVSTATLKVFTSGPKHFYVETTPRMLAFLRGLGHEP